MVSLQTFGAVWLCPAAEYVLTLALLLGPKLNPVSSVLVAACPQSWVCEFKPHISKYESAQGYLATD